MSNNQQQNQEDMGSTYLAQRIDAQMEIFGKVSSDYAEILKLLAQFKTEIEELKKEYRKEYKDILIDIHLIANNVETYNTQTISVLQSLEDIVSREHEEMLRLITNLDHYQRTLENNINNLIKQVEEQTKECKEQGEEINQRLLKVEENIITNLNALGVKVSTGFVTIEDKIDDNESTTKVYREKTDKLDNSIDENINSLCRELIQKKRKIVTKISYVTATLVFIWVLLQSLAQLNIIHIEWFAK